MEADAPEQNTVEASAIKEVFIQTSSLRQSNSERISLCVSAWKSKIAWQTQLNTQGNIYIYINKKKKNCLAWTKWEALSSRKGYTFPVTQHASLVFPWEIMGEQKSRAGDRGRESLWAREEIGHTGTAWRGKDWYQEDLRRGVTLRQQRGEQCVTLMRYRGRREGANVSESKGQLMKTAGSWGIKATGREEGVACGWDKQEWVSCRFQTEKYSSKTIYWWSTPL